ncbi:MAG: site-specific integrase [Nitrospirota bacterium]|nr:site-specific integrase [Nitrospirota bacterium]
MALIEKRVGTHGNVTYRARIRTKGHPPEIATFQRKGDAQKWVQSTESAIRENRHFNRAETRRRTLAELIDRYEAEVLPHKAATTQKGQARQLKWWKDRLGDYALAQVTPALITDALGTLKVGPSSKNRYLAVLSHTFTYAVKVRGWLDRSPAHGIDKGAIGIREGRGRARFLSKDERKRLLEACKAHPNPYIYPAVVVAISTGMRAGEQFGLTWDRVDLKAGRIRLEDTKNGERRTVPLTGHALEEMRGLIHQVDTPHVFPQAKGAGPAGLRTQWEAVARAAELEDFRWHDLRHSFASELAMSGATLAELAEAMGHKTLAMVKRYAHLTEGHTSRVVERMTARLFGE